MVYTRTYIFNHFYSKYLVLLTTPYMVPRNLIRYLVYISIVLWSENTAKKKLIPSCVPGISYNIPPPYVYEYRSQLTPQQKHPSFSTNPHSTCVRDRYTACLCRHLSVTLVSLRGNLKSEEKKNVFL